MHDLHAIVQECSRAIASHESPEQSFPDVAAILAQKTCASEVAVIVQSDGDLTGLAAEAMRERRLRVGPANGGMTVAAPVKNAGRVFGVLQAIYIGTPDRSLNDHAISDIVSAVGVVLGNALALAERAPQEGAGAATRDRAAFDQYVRAHWELYRSYRVPFSIAIYDMRNEPQLARLSATAALRWSVRCSDAVFALGGGLVAVLLANCSLSGAHVAAARVEQHSGLGAHKMSTPRRGESARRFQTRATLLDECTPVH